MTVEETKKVGFRSAATVQEALTIGFESQGWKAEVAVLGYGARILPVIGTRQKQEARRCDTERGLERREHS
jgi:hypothetical protein